jgi:hypothetical protein
VSAHPKSSLDHLIDALTADGRPDELAGRDAALAAFRAAGGRDAAERASAQRQRTYFHRPMSVRLAALGTTLAVAAGIATAAYTRNLPGPAQEVPHTVFAPLGVPDNQQPGPGTGPATGPTGGVTVATPSEGSGRPTPSPATRTPSPRPAGDYRVTVAVSRTRVPAGGTVTLTGRLTEHDRPVARALVRLFERLAGSTQFALVTEGVTGPLGGFSLTSPPLTATSVFRVLGPDNVHSAAVRVAVAGSKVTAGAAPAAPGRAPTGR